MIIEEETAEQYHARKAVSASFLWDIVKPDGCPAQAFYDSVFNPESHAPEREHHLDIGTAAHLAILENQDFASRCSLIAFENYRTKEARELRDQCYIDGKTPLLKSDYDLVNRVRAALLKSEAGGLFFGFGSGQSEVSYTWEIDAIPCKARADRILSNGKIIDLKTAACASPEAFQRAMVRDGHHLRAAWYMDGWNEQHQEEFLRDEFSRDYLYVVIAKAEPHLVEVYQLDEGAIHKGRALYRKAFGIAKHGLETGEWPGYARRAARIGLPTWYEYRLADMEANGELEL